MKYLLSILLLLISVRSFAQTTVNSLAELMPFLKQDGVNVKLLPGTYWITGEEASAGMYGVQAWQDHVKSLLYFEGSNSTYDFTGVTLKIETSVFQSLGSYDVYKFHVIGSNNVFLNLTMEDIGSVHDAPTKGALTLCLDGAGNRVEGFHTTSKGSYPYGYGESFGKGGPYTVSGIKKHSSFLVRGYENHVKNCKIYHRGYGHALFMQAADKPLIEGCYIEGEMRSTEDMLAEAGTGTVGDDIDFMTYFGYPIPPGYMMCLNEEGIRAYNGGNTIIDGVEYERGTSNPTILNNTIYRLRSGVTLTHATGTKYVEGCTTIECQRGYAIGSGQIVDCKSDAKYGPALAVDYATDKGMTADITILNSDQPYNGSKHLAYLIGSNHTVTLRSSDPSADQSLLIEVGGDSRTVGNLNSDENYAASNITINNHTGFPVILDDQSSNISGVSCGPVTDNGSGNGVSTTECQAPELHYEAESYVEMNGVAQGDASDDGEGQMVSFSDQGDWADLLIDLHSPELYKVELRVASDAGGSLALQQDGKTMKSLSIDATGGSQSWTTISTTMVLLDGERKFRLYNESGEWNLNWVKFEAVDEGHVFALRVSSEPQDVVLKKGETFQMTPKVIPSEANQEVTYVIEDPNIATIDQSGLVTAVDNGTTYLEVRSVDGDYLDRSSVTVERSEGRNLALSGTATQSSTDYEGVPERAIDGNTNGNWAGGSVTHTGHTDSVKWWQVDLGAEKVIDDIVVYNRIGYSDRLNDITVEVINAQGDIVFSKFFGTPPNYSVTADAGDVVGQIVKVWKTSEHGMTLAEVEVYGKDLQTIFFDRLDEKVVGDEDFDPGASSDSSLPISYTSSNPEVATIVDDKIHIVSSGISIITASQKGDAQMGKAKDVSQELIVLDPLKSDQTILFDEIGTKTFGDEIFSLNAVASSNLDVTYMTSDHSVAEIVEGKVKINQTGSCIITAIQEGNGSFNAASEAQQLIVEKADQTIEFNALPVKTFGDEDFDPGAKASTELRVLYFSSNQEVATILNDMIQIVGTGSSTITAIQAGNIFYNETSSEQVLVVDKAEQAIVFEEISVKSVLDGDFKLEATASSSLPITYTSSNPEVATVLEGNIHIEGAGSSVITAIQEGNDNYKRAEATQNLTVEKVGQSITFYSLPEKTVGDNDFSPYAKASSGLDVSFISSNLSVATIMDGNIHITGAGESIITAVQPGDDIYAPADSVQKIFTVKAITLSSNDEQEIELFPNPVGEFLQVQLPLGVYKHFNLFRIDGSHLQYGIIEEGNQKAMIDFDGFASGVYILELVATDSHKRLKVLKE